MISRKPLFALAFGTLGLGISEFVMMGLLPYVAHAMDVSIPTAGHLISAYALGVCFGAPAVTLIAYRQPLKRVLVALFVLYVLGMSLSAVSCSYSMLLCARFVSGIPHGAFFGVGSIVAERLASGSRASESISIMNSGMTIANVFGVPLGTFLAGHLIPLMGPDSWRVIFCLAALWGLLTLLALWRWVPHQDALPDTGLRGQFRFLLHVSPLYVILATLFSNGGIFCWYSYILPQMQTLAGLGTQWQTALMVLAGLGMVCGNLIGGRLASSHRPERFDLAAQSLAVVLLLLMSLFAHSAIISVTLMVLLAGLLFSFGPAQSTLILQHAYGGKMMAAAFIQIAFNFGNAAGAYLGGLPLEAGLGYRIPPLIGAAMLSLGCLALFLYSRHHTSRPV